MSPYLEQGCCQGQGGRVEGSVLDVNELHLPSQVLHLHVEVLLGKEHPKTTQQQHHMHLVRSSKNKVYVSVGKLGSREQGNLRKCSQSALESALRNRALGSAPERVLSRVVFLLSSTQINSKTTVESTFGSTPESTPISESTLESILGVLSEISLFSGPWLANRHT